MVLIVTAAMILAAAGVVLLGQAHARQALEDRFALRATLGATFVASYASDIIRREQLIATTELAAGSVTADKFEQVVHTFGFEAAVLLDERGTVLHVQPAAPGVIGLNLGEQYEHLGRAVSGVSAVSNGVRSAVTGHPIVAFAAPFETLHGRRVISGGFYLGSTPLSAYLHSAVPFSTAAAYLVDGKGDVVESNIQGAGSMVSLAAANPGLAAAVATASHGSYVENGMEQRFATQDVEGSPLKLVLTVPSAQLYAPLAGPTQWAPWLLLALLVVGAGYLLAVLSALSRSWVALRASGEELERSNRELQDFASIASHDLQEPLRKIQAFGDRLTAGHGEALGETGRDYLDRMTAAAARMQLLIEGLLAYSRVATQAQVVVRVPMRTVMTEVLVDLEQRLVDSQGEVHVDGTLPSVDADPMQLRQLMQNLIGNALKYRRAEAAPQVRVSCNESSAGWTLEVSDNGIGFAQEQADRIFAPFQRLHGRGSYEGTGMGLAICRRIVERHHGTISAHASPGAGARFVVTLPRAASPAATP